MNTSKILNHMNGRLAKKRGVVNIGDNQITHDDLAALGINVKAMDSALIGGGGGGVPGYIPRHVLETWLDGTLRTITQVRNIDRLVGESTVGRWEDDAINLMVETAAGDPELYGDNTNIPLADIRTTVERRGVVRFELGFRTGELEGKRLSAVGIDVAASKRRAVSEALDTGRNRVGFYGYAYGATNIYGFLNDPSLAGYIARGASGTSSKDWDDTPTFATLTQDFGAMFKVLVQQSGGHVQRDASMVFVIPTKFIEVLDVVHATNMVTFGEWITRNYPNTRIENTPELDAANTKGGAYLFVENAGQYDDSDVMGATMIQAVPDRFRVLGSEVQIKGYVEDCVNATAGVFVLRPWAVVRIAVK